jgi:hypothetical protein
VSKICRKHNGDEFKLALPIGYTVDRNRFAGRDGTGGRSWCPGRRRWQPRTDDARRAHIGSILGSLLGLLALLLGFTFAMTANRYDARRQLVVNDANALGALYVQSSLLPDAPRKAFKQLLGQYVDQRAEIALLRRDKTDDELAQIEARAESLQNQMWMVLKGAAESQPPARIADAMLERLIGAISIQRERLFGWENRVPDSIVWLLLFGALTAITVLGFLGGLGKHRGLPARIAVTLLLCATIYVTLDLDKPHQGLIRVSQSPMLRLKQNLDRDTETKP